MLVSLQRMLEYVAFALAPHLDARLDLIATLAVGALLVLVFAALVAMPRRARVGFAVVPVATRPRRMTVVRHPLRGRRVRPVVRARAPSTVS